MYISYRDLFNVTPAGLVLSVAINDISAAFVSSKNVRERLSDVLALKCVVAFVCNDTASLSPPEIGVDVAPELAADDFLSKRLLGF